jgi:hypothetical protein
VRPRGPGNEDGMGTIMGYDLYEIVNWKILILVPRALLTRGQPSATIYIELTERDEGKILYFYRIF